MTVADNRFAEMIAERVAGSPGRCWRPRTVGTPRELRGAVEEVRSVLAGPDS